MKTTLAFFLLTTVSGCALPLKVAQTMDTTVIDSTTLEPIANAQYFRIVCDLHDYDCSSAYIERGFTSNDGKIDLGSKRKWSIWFPAPGGLPVPNHQIAIWASGYTALLFSQYNQDIERFRQQIEREDINRLINEVPENRKYLDSEEANRAFLGGIIKLKKIYTLKEKHNNGG